VVEGVTMKTEISNKLEEALNAIHDARLMSKDLLVTLYLEQAEVTVKRAKAAHKSIKSGRAS
jgi:hypothetical protein